MSIDPQMIDASKLTHVLYGYVQVFITLVEGDLFYLDLNRFADCDASTGQVKLTDTFADQTVSRVYEYGRFFF
jgi:hypothetical protein